jgi:hypothetical protein
MSVLVHEVMLFLPCRPGPVFLAQRSVYPTIVLAVVIPIAHSLIFEDDYRTMYATVMNSKAI